VATRQWVTRVTATSVAACTSNTRLGEAGGSRSAGSRASAIPLVLTLVGVLAEDRLLVLQELAQLVRVEVVRRIVAIKAAATGLSSDDPWAANEDDGNELVRKALRETAHVAIGVLRRLIFGAVRTPVVAQRL